MTVIKVENLSKKYFLTAKGFSAKVTQTYNFLQRKLAEFDRLKKEIEALRQENHEDQRKELRNQGGLQ